MRQAVEETSYARPRKRMAMALPSQPQPDPEVWKRRVEALAQDSHRAYWLALRVVGSPALAEEAVQEAYARLLQQPRVDEGHAQALVYLIKTARSAALDLARSAGARKRREEAHAMSPHEDRTSPEELSATQEAALAARTALQQLSQDEREAVSLCCEQDLTRQAASEILGLPERTISERVQRGLGKLQRMLAAQGYAALTPLALGEGLRALGVPSATPQLTEAVELAIRTAGQSVRRSLRMAARHSSSASPAWIIGGTLLAGAALGAWVLASHTPTVPPAPAPIPAVKPTPVVTVPALVPAKPVEETPFLMRWNFSEGPSPAIQQFLVGTWTWKRPNAIGPGFMDVADEVTLVLPGSMPPRPLLVTIRYRGRKNGSFGVQANWFEGGEYLPGKFWNYGWNGSPLGSERFNYTYFLGSYIANLHDTQAIPFEKRNFQPAPPPILAALKPLSMAYFGEYARPNPSKRIFVHFKNVEVLEIVLQSLRAEEIPSLLRDPADVASKLGEPTKR